MLNFKSYKSETDGNVAMMFAVTSIMLLTGIGAAVDFSNMSRAKNMLQSQVDAGVFAAATVKIERRGNGVGSTVSNAVNGNQEFRTRKEAAKEVISANGFDLNGIEPVLTLYERSVVLSAELDYRPFFGGILGIDEIRLKADAESGLPGLDGVDIALVLDNTRSMEVENKMAALKQGAIKLVDAIEESDSSSKIALVPFSRYARVSDSARTASWFQMPVEYDTPRTWDQATHSGGTCTTESYTETVDGVELSRTRENCTGQTTTYEERSTTIESRWDGCVGTRLPPYSERDDAYSHKIPGLLNKVPKERSGLGHDVSASCPAEIIPMSDDYRTLKTKINSMWTTDNTYLPTGLIWGQRVLSPGLPYDNTPGTGDILNRKVMVLMTDGHNTTQIDRSSLAQSEYRAPPYISNGATDVVQTEANAATSRICENAKAADIEIYTIAFKVTDMTTINLLRNCASSSANALRADDNTALVENFERIAAALEADIRLMR